MKPELIIIDCDGTLADSETMHQLAVIGALERCGVSRYDVEFCFEHFVGRGMTYVQQFIEKREGRALSPNFIPFYIELCQKLLLEGMKPIPHALDSVMEFSKHYKICVASNGEADTVKETIQSIGMMNLFGQNHIFTKNQVALGKPAPDLFLFAANQMGISPDKCIVIEDSIAGAMAGVAAGMLTIGITAVSHSRLETTENMKKVGVQHIFQSWPEIVTFIKTL